MTTIQIHPRSIVLGLALGGVVLFSMAQSAAPVGATVRVQYMPHPRDMVQIEEGTPYTVPGGKVFVLTALGSVEHASPEVVLYIDGQREVGVRPDQVGQDIPTVKPCPSGLTALPGATVEAVGGSSSVNDGRAWGYLADQ